MTTKLDKLVHTVTNLLVVLFLVATYALAAPTTKISAAELIISTGSDWDSGSKTSLDTSVNDGDIQLQADGSWNARSWKTPDQPISIGSAFASDGTDIYATRGLADSLFWKYSTQTNTWTELARMPRGTYYGADLVYLDGYIFAIFGGYQTTFARYSIATNTWQELSDIPDLTYLGASIATDGTNIFALKGNSGQEFYKYDVSTGIWSLLASAPATIGAGADLVYNSGYLYTPRGNSTNTMYRYDIAGNSWSTMATLPATIADHVDISTDGTTIFVPRQNNTTSLYAYNIAGNSWSTLTSQPLASRYAGVVYNSNDGYLYIFRGNGTYNFWKYSILGNNFVGPEDAPAAFSTGSDMVQSGGILYVPRGANTTTFYSYNTSSGAWSTLAAAPASFTDDTKGVAAGSYIYFFRGSNTVTFYRYSIAENSWSTMADAPATVRYGGALAYPGSGNYIYATRGNTTGSFWRYNISGNSWDDVSVADLPADAESSYGSRLISDDADVYYFPGLGIKRFFKYDVSGNTWNEIAAIPFAPYYGSDIAYQSGKFVALAGWYKNDLWEYSISSNTWRKLQDTQGYLAQNNGAYSGASIEYDGNGTFFIQRGSNTVDLTSYTPGSGNFVSAGTWISEAQDLEYVSEWTSLTSTSVTPSDSAVSFQTRTSTDSASWSSWSSVTSGSIQSPPYRYLQLKAVLVPSAANAATPTLKDITVTYSSDINDPTNPDTFLGSSQEIGGSSLSNGETYTDINPYFSWSGHSDAETLVDGFYVYFGTNEAADPEAVGDYQTTTSYIVTTPLSTGTYYLRLKTKDSAGNISDAVTGFTYVYGGISPAQSLTISESDEFLGTATSVNTTNDEIKLTSKSNGFWLQETLTTPPAALQYGAKNVAYDSDTNKLYVLRGSNSTTFYEYDVTGDTWSTLAAAPGNVRMGGGMIEGPEGYLYGLMGNNTTSFWRYDIDANTWSDEDAADAPLTVYYGGAAVYDEGQYIYVMRGNNDDAFWRYNTNDDSWETLASADFGATSNAVNNNVYQGGDLTIDAGSQMIYAIQGGIKDGFAAYNINTNAWSALPDLPQLPYLGSSVEYSEDSSKIYYVAGYNSNKMFSFDIAEQTWTELASTPVPLNYGANLKAIGDYLYLIQAGNTTGFYKYSIAKNSWLVPNRGLFGREYLGTSYLGANYGSDIVKGNGNYFYITRGLYADDFIRWDSTTGTATRMANAPVGTFSGSAMVYDSVDNKIYLTGGINVQKFYSYDIATNTWSEESADPPLANIDYGASMVYDGSRYIYLNRGGNTNTLYQYDTQAPSGNRWSTRANIPAAVGYGAELLLNGNFIYTLRGQNIANNPFYRFDISGNTWSDPAVADLNIDVNNDGFLVDGGDGNFYAARGENDTDFFKYSVSDNSWNALNNTPVRVFSGGAAESNGTNKIHMLSGIGTGSYSDAIYTYVMPTENSAFEEEGDYTSPAHDLTAVYKWANLVVDYTSTNNTALSIQTRTSGDNITWSSWTAVAQEKQIGTEYTYQIKSSPQRYIQVKFSLTSADGVHSGVISDYTVNYYKDTTAPTNPVTAGLSVYSDNTPGTAIVSDTWYGHSSPYFDWPDAEATNGASDSVGGSGIQGYYVYFGTDELADPLAAGSLQIASDYTASGLSNNTTYYLRIKTVDNAGNVSDTVWSPYIYKYDSEGPSIPANLTSDPSGYSSTDSFDFSWDIASASGAAVSAYCYKTGATTGTFASDQCISETAISEIPSYKVGTNTFFVRTKDAAGNYSSYTTTPYYYVNSDNAPAPPQNLTVTPTSSTDNSFAFSWDAPATGTFYGSASNLSYYYSINALPTSQSTTATSLRSLTAGAYATLPGENVFYIVTKDEAGNINYSNYASVTFTANTTAPGIPLNIDIADVSVKSTSSWKLAISWEAPTAGTVSSYAIYRSLDGENYTLRSTSGGISFVDVGLTQQLYYYKVKACDSTNNCGAFSDAVSLLPDGKYITAAELVAGPTVSDITTKKVTVTWSTGRTSDSRIAFGTSSGDYFDTEVSNSEQTTIHQLTLPNLTPGTKYYYVARWTDEDGNLGTSEEETFETSPPPATKEPTITFVGLDNVILQFVSQNASRVRIYYGETSTFGGVEDVVVGTNEGTHTVQIKDLLDGTKYYYKINSFDVDGEEYEGEVHSFTTLPRPKIENVTINQVKGTASSTLLINWESNTEVSSIVTYYPLNLPSLAQDEINIALKAGKHQMILYNLTPQTTYGVIIKGKDVAGNEAAAEIQQVTTSADTRPPQISDLKVDGEIIGTGDEATAQLIVSFKTDEASTAQVEFGEGSGSVYSQKTQEDGTLSNNHLVVISELTPAKVYHLRATSSDSFGNKAESTDKVVITPNATENALDLVITSMSSIFGFLKN
ncbi:MAG: large repetitive protein [Patescibacteria group bacterium]|nr:large repetitive protein [Patescibacteria group bacterium]